MAKVIQGSVSISRRQTNGHDKFVISFYDESSHKTFAVAHMDHKAFANAITGLHGCEAQIEIDGLQFVGKQKETVPAAIWVDNKELRKHGINPYDRHELEAYIKANHQREGWFLAEALDSQRSIVHHKNGVELNIAYYRYVAPGGKKKKKSKR